jgi:hypothetical protein
VLEAAASAVRSNPRTPSSPTEGSAPKRSLSPLHIGESRRDDVSIRLDVDTVSDVEATNIGHHLARRIECSIRRPVGVVSGEREVWTFAVPIVEPPGRDDAPVGLNGNGLGRSAAEAEACEKGCENGTGRVERDVQR